MKREKCVLCGNNHIEEIFRINDMPSFMGVVDNDNDNDNITEVIKNDLIIGECSICGLIQNINLLNPELVYLNNHNTEVVGEIWKQHYIELSNFIKKNVKGNVVLEIGDPSAKLAKKLKNDFDKWIIIEPNTDLEDFDNVKIVKGFFDGEKPTDDKYNTIVHSHVLEHIYDPVKFLNDCNNILEYGDSTIFSIPNIKWILQNNGLPTSVLHFEHTYYIDDENVEKFLNQSGFQLDDIYYYKNHSLFIKATKKSNMCIYENNININININKIDLKKIFLENVEYYKNQIKYINEKLQDKEYYLYSAHINSQFMLNNNISKNIKGILDKSTSKIGKKLYGYDYEIYSPDIIIKETCIVVASHMGVYFNEIEKDLKSKNKNIIIL